MTDAADIKSFAYNLDSCYLYGNRDKKSNVAWFLTDKNRRGAVQDMLVRMNGAMSRFERADNYVEDRRGNFVKEDELNAIPTAEEEESKENKDKFAGGYMM